MSFEESLALRRWPIFGLRSPRYQLALAAVERYARLIEVSPLHPIKAEHFAAEIDCVRHALEHRTWHVIPSPWYNLASAELNQLRDEFCRELPLAPVCGELVEEISDDLEYLDPPSAKAKRADLGQVRIYLMEKICGNDAVNELAQRVRLEAISQLAARARGAHWLKVNMARNRLAIIAVAVTLVLLGVLLIMPPGLCSGLRDGGDIRERYLWVIMMFGAMGGLISATMDTQPVDTRAGEYYIYRRLLYLRSAIGAGLAMVVPIALIAIVGIWASPLNPSYLVIAFASGFAERVFTRRLLKIAGAGEFDRKMKPITERRITNHAV